MNFFSFVNSFKPQANLNAYFTLIIVFQFQSQIIDAKTSLLGRFKNTKKISTSTPTLPTTPPKTLIKRSASHLDPYLYLSKFQLFDRGLGRFSLSLSRSLDRANDFAGNAISGSYSKRTPLGSLPSGAMFLS